MRGPRPRCSKHHAVRVRTGWGPTGLPARSPHPAKPLGNYLPHPTTGTWTGRHTTCVQKVPAPARRSSARTKKPPKTCCRKHFARPATRLLHPAAYRATHAHEPPGRLYVCTGPSFERELVWACSLVECVGPALSQRVRDEPTEDVACCDPAHPAAGLLKRGETRQCQAGDDGSRDLGIGELGGRVSQKFERADVQEQEPEMLRPHAGEARSAAPLGAAQSRRHSRWTKLDFLSGRLHQYARSAAR